MTIYKTTAVPGQLTPPAPLDPQAVRQLGQHALDVLMPAAIEPGSTPLGEAAGQIAAALCSLARLVEADADDQLAQGEDVVERLRRASLRVHEHMVATVPAADLEARSAGLIESCIEEGLPVVASVSADLVLSGGRTVRVRLTKETAHQEAEVGDGDTVRIPAADHLLVRDGLHELGRVLAPLTQEAITQA
ncbi:hypothetical protein [Streptomyces anulatus]|uniref:hypothetical protein n=1 Tax=Streptomyces anulatus TaxID=1892 RepID=UPI00364B0E57